MILGEIFVDGNAQVGLTLGEGAFGVVSARGSVHRWGQLWIFFGTWNPARVDELIGGLFDDFCCS